MIGRIRALLLSLPILCTGTLGSLAAAATKHTDRFEKVPAGGRLWLQIVDPDGISPPMALSIEGRSEKGAYLLNPAHKPQI